MKKNRAMKDISLNDRKKILIDAMMMKSKDVMQKHNITKNVFGHIKFFHGKSTAKARGHYHKDLLENVKDPKIEKIRSMKADGKTSGQASEITGIDLEKVNKLWSTIKI